MEELISKLTLISFLNFLMGGLGLLNLCRQRKIFSLLVCVHTGGDKCARSNLPVPQFSNQVVITLVFHCLISEVSFVGSSVSQPALALEVTTTSQCKDFPVFVLLKSHVSPYYTLFQNGAINSISSSSSGNCAALINDLRDCISERSVSAIVKDLDLGMCKGFTDKHTRNLSVVKCQNYFQISRGTVNLIWFTIM